MTWSNPSDVLTTFRDQLLLCASVIGVPLVEADFHYPSFGVTGAAPSDLPAVLLQEPVEERERYAEQALPLIGGTLKAAFYFPESVASNAGYMETFCRTVIKELGLQFSGLAFRRFSVSLSTDPKPAARAAGVDDSANMYRAATITVEYGLSR